MSNTKQNLIEKIAQRFAVGLNEGQFVHAGDYVSISPSHVMSHDNTGAIIPKFRAIGATTVARPSQVVITLDHNIQDTGEANLEKYRKIEAFAVEVGAEFYPAGRGIGHQVMCEEGYVLPGSMVVASDSHSNMYGGLGCLGTPVVRTDAAAIWATGRTWWQIPPVARVTLTGKLRPGVTAKDVIVTLCGHFNSDEVLNHSLEITGNGVATLSVDERLTIANMSTEWGALAAVFPADGAAFSWLDERIEAVSARGEGEHPRLNRDAIDACRDGTLAADPDAFYSIELSLDLGTVSPFVSGPNHVKVMQPAAQMGDIAIHKAYLVSCVNSRVEDLAAAAQVARGQKVAEGVELYVAAASSEVQAASEARGDWQTLVDAGARPLPPGCGPCIGLGVGLLEDGEVGISATNRNFRGRMGSLSSEAYLASPAVVMASAVAGRIVTPFDTEVLELAATATLGESRDAGAGAVPIIDGFPAEIAGDLVFCPADNLNTDGIYPGKYTYIDEFTAEQQARVVMENYDPSFVGRVKKGDLLVGGFNFGTGSSREQAATALKHRGLGLVIAGSLSETYKRNALNNGFLAITCPALVRDLKCEYGEESLTVLTGKRARISFVEAVIEVGEHRYGFAAVGAAAQELIVVGGLENWVKDKI